jgi:hypothetical protein
MQWIWDPRSTHTESSSSLFQILACPSETERQRWLQATTPPTSENPYETLYEQWDCPQVVVKHAYKPIEPDELTLEVGDVVNVLRKMKDDGEIIARNDSVHSIM